MRDPELMLWGQGIIRNMCPLLESARSERKRECSVQRMLQNLLMFLKTLWGVREGGGVEEMFPQRLQSNTGSL